MTPALAKKLNFKPGAKLVYVRMLADDRAGSLFDFPSPKRTA